MNERTMTAPLAIVQVNGVTIGKMRNIRVTEQIRRGRVSGLGRLTAEELPALEWSGSLSCSSYTINFNLLMNKSRLGTFRNAQTINDWANAILLQEDGLEISLLRKVKDGEIDPESGMVKTKFQTFAKVNAAFATREGFDVQEGQISGRDTEFEYLEPILYNDVV